jgi:preprotein translocase subunit YajC
MIGILMNTFALAAAQSPAAQQGAAQPAAGQQGPGLQQFLPMIVVIIALFYFMILRPQKKEQRKREETLGAVAKGDSVVTVGGIHGTVESVDPAKGIVTVLVAPKVSLRFSKTAISSVTKKKDAPKKEGGEGGAED